MSYQHTQRRKTIRRFKEKFGEKKWWTEFIGHTCKCRREILGPPIGTLEEIMRIRKGLKNERTHSEAVQVFCANDLDR